MEWKRMKTLVLKWKAIQKEKKGASLVELILVFMLLSILLVGVSQMLIISVRVYHNIRGLNEAYQVSDTLLDKISGEIEGAQVGVSGVREEDNSDTATLKIEDSNKKIDLYDRTGSHIYITVDEKKLLIYYYEVVSENEDGSRKTTRYEAVDWRYDESVYMGYEIEKLSFQRSDEYMPNVIIVTLTLGKNGEESLTQTRYVECYNFQDTLDYAKISGGQ